MPGYSSQLVLSLGQSAAEIIANFAPIPGLGVASGVLGAIMQLAENVITNRSVSMMFQLGSFDLMLV